MSSSTPSSSVQSLNGTSSVTCFFSAIDPRTRETQRLQQEQTQHHVLFHSFCPPMLSLNGTSSLTLFLPLILGPEEHKDYTMNRHNTMSSSTPSSPVQSLNGTSSLTLFLPLTPGPEEHKDYTRNRHNTMSSFIPSAPQCCP